MIVQVKFKNFLSFKNEQELDFFSNEFPLAHLGDNVQNFKDVHVHKIVPILGANGSGKTNLLEAISAVKTIMETGQLHYDYKPFASEEGKPIELSIGFIVNNRDFQYSIVFDEYKVYSESLSEDKNETQVDIFRRVDMCVTKNEDYFDSSVCEPALTDERAYLPTLPYGVFGEIVKYFLYTVSPLGSCDVPFDDGVKKQVGNFLKHMDTGIERFDGDMDVYMIDGQEHKLPSSERSSGVNRIIELACAFLDALKNGKVLIIDGFEESLHPLSLEVFIEMFKNAQLNKNKAQLIFSTHCIDVLDDSKIYKDQVVLCQKENNVSTAYSMSEFKDLDHTHPIAEYYRTARMGGTPKIAQKSADEALNVPKKH